MKTKNKTVGFDQVLDAFNQGKVINENVTLKQIAEVSKRLKDDFGDDLAAWTFIGPNYIYKGDDEISRDIHISR